MSDTEAAPTTETEAAALDYEALTVVEQLVIETLAARVRLGEHMWTFTRRVQRQLRHLERLGWISWKHGIVQWTCLVWFTDAGRSAALDDAYTPPAAVLPVVESWASTAGNEQRDDDEEVKKALRLEVQRLRDRLHETRAEYDGLRARIRALHHELPEGFASHFCAECSMAWPCPTIRALEDQ